MKRGNPIFGVRDQLREARRKAKKPPLDLEGKPLHLDALFADLRKMTPIRGENEVVELIVNEQHWIRLTAMNAHIRAGTWMDLCALKRLELKLRRKKKSKDAALLRRLHTKLLYNHPIPAVDSKSLKP